MLNQLDVTISRHDDGTVSAIEIHGGKPDQCGHRLTASISTPSIGSGYVICTNFDDFFERRCTLEDAMGCASMLVLCAGQGAPVDAELEG